MFKDYLVSEYVEDINDIFIREIKEKDKPVIVLGCGGSGRIITAKLADAHIKVEAYCEGRRYWHEGKVFLGTRVINVESLLAEYEEASVIVAATGQDVIDLIERFQRIDGYSIYGFVERKQLYEMDSQWVFQHEEDLSKSYDILADDISRITFLSYIGARANCIDRTVTVPLISLWNSKQYFNDLYPKDRWNKHVLVDCGAWIGDSAEAFLDFMRTESNDVIVQAFEMEPDNYKALEKISEKYNNIICYNYGVGDKHEVVYFEKKSDASAIVDYKTDYSVEIVPVDEILNGDKGFASMVKMDLEGYERYALAGMSELIKNNLPALAICVYHKLDDLIVIPSIIRQLETEVDSATTRYKYYLRHHSHNAAELVFYAIPYEV